MWQIFAANMLSGCERNWLFKGFQASKNGFLFWHLLQMQYFLLLDCTTPPMWARESVWLNLLHSTYCMTCTAHPKHEQSCFLFHYPFKSKNVGTSTFITTICLSNLEAKALCYATQSCVMAVMPDWQNVWLLVVAAVRNGIKVWRSKDEHCWWKDEWLV